LALSDFEEPGVKAASRLEGADLLDAEARETEAEILEASAAGDIEELAPEETPAEPSTDADIYDMRKAAREFRVFKPSPLAAKTVAQIQGKASAAWTVEAVLERAFRLGTPDEDKESF
jgi:uncharacterized protein with PhoU and TrkA domain